MSKDRYRIPSSLLDVCMYVYIYIYLFIYLFIYLINLFIYLFIYIYICIYTDIYLLIFVFFVRSAASEEDPTAVPTDSETQPAPVTATGGDL